MEIISTPSLEKFATSFMKSGNINLINDVVKVFHRLKHNVDMVRFSCVTPSVFYFLFVKILQDHLQCAMYQSVHEKK